MMHHRRDDKREGAGQSWGGKREGAGRKASGRRKANFYITQREEEFLRDCLFSFRTQTNAADLIGQIERDGGEPSLLAEASGKSLEEVMALKNSGNTWGDVAKSLGVTKAQVKAVHQDIAATKLENKLGISRQTGLVFLQQGYHPRNIAIADKLSKYTGTSMHDILSMKKNSNSWHDIANALGVDKNRFKQGMEELKTVFPHGGHGFRDA